MFSLIFPRIAKSLVDVPSRYTTLPDSCTDAGYTSDLSSSLRANKETCFFTKPGFFFGTGLIIEVYWQDKGETDGFYQLGPVKSGCVVNVQADFAYIVITSPTNQTIQYFPSTSLSYSSSNYAGTTYQYTTYFSTKNVTQYNLSMYYTTSPNATSYSYQYLLLLGDNVSVTDQLKQSINDGESNKTRNPYPTKVANDGSMNFVSFGTITFANDIKISILYQTPVNATLKCKSGVPEFSGVIPNSPSLATINDIDNSYKEAVIVNPKEFGSPTNSSASNNSGSLSYVFIIGVAIGVLAIVALVSVLVIIRKRNRPHIEGADQSYDESVEETEIVPSEASEQSSSYEESYYESSSQINFSESSDPEISIASTEQTNTNTCGDATATQGDLPAPQ